MSEPKTDRQRIDELRCLAQRLGDMADDVAATRRRICGDAAEWIGRRLIEFHQATEAYRER